MGKWRNIVCVLLFSFSVVTVCEAKEWHGIVPLHSTRVDVERLLGKPNGKFDRYQIGNDEVDIMYSRERCANGWNVPRDTVISVAVFVGGSPPLSDLQPDLSNYNKEPDQHLRGRVYYVNASEGIRYHVQEQAGKSNKVIVVYYEPAEKDKNLRCSVSSSKATALADNPHCPAIAIACSPSLGGDYTCTLNLTNSPPSDELGFKWKISSGHIISGQSTYVIAVQPKCEKEAAMLTVEILQGLPRECPTSASYKIDCSTLRPLKTPN
jgi:hypothetical protein